MGAAQKHSPDMWEEDVNRAARNAIKRPVQLALSDMPSKNTSPALALQHKLTKELSAQDAEPMPLTKMQAVGVFFVSVISTWGLGYILYGLL